MMTDLSVPKPLHISKTGVHLEMIEEVPMMVAGDKPFWGFMYTFDPIEGRPYIESIRSMYAHGVRLFSFLLPLPVVWDKPGAYDFTLVDELHDKVLEAAPEGLFYPRIFMTTPYWWDEGHPDEMLGFRKEFPTVDYYEVNGPAWKYAFKMFHSPRNPSLASRKWREDASEALAAYVRHTWEGNYAGHWFAYQIAYGCCGEWTPFGTYINNRFGSFDVSKPMASAFRSFLRAKYGSDEALRAAWKEPGVTIGTAEPPTKTQLLKQDIGILKDPRNCRHSVDWVELYSNQLHEAMLHFCRVVKEASPVPVLAGSFAGYRLQMGASSYTTHLAQIHLEQLLNSDVIDIVSTPNCYENRAKGVFSQAPIATIARKKIFCAENDVRSHLSGHSESSLGCGPDRMAAIRHFKRDTFYDLTQGSGHQWWYDFGLGWYLDNGLEAVVARLVDASVRIAPADRIGCAEVALVIDEESSGYTEGSVGYYRLSRECINEHLPRMGAPFDCITYDDMAEREPYKLYIFRDMFYVPDEKLKRLRKSLVENNSSAVWIYASGMLGETGIDTDRAEMLTGFRFGLADLITSQQLTVIDSSHPLTKEVPLTQGTLGNEDIRGVYGPVLYVDDDRAEILGQIESIEKPGIAFKREGLRFDAWVASPLLSYHLLANLAAEAGAHRFVDPGVALFGKGRIFSLQSEVDRSITFTARHRLQCVEDLLTGQAYRAKDNKVELSLSAHDPMLLKLKVVDEAHG